MTRVGNWLRSGLIWCSLFALLGQPAIAVQGTAKAYAPPSTSASLEKVTTDTATGIEEYKLKSNGLQVLLAERHQTPVVTVMVVYHVGSRNEAVGYTGSTHFLEHMMFRGTKRHDPRKGTGIDDVLKPIGGINNATTYYDRTSYYEVVPAQYMSTCLDLEADRMRGALLRESDQKAEMTVVRNELERDEDDPSRLMEVNTFAHAFMAHPYHHPVIGWRSDVENVPISRLRKFYDEFYYPNNATLVVIGDFHKADALRQIAKYFGAVPASPHPFPNVYTSEPQQQGERRFTVKRGADLPKIAIAYHIPKSASPDSYALEVAASVLGDEKRQSSRLYKRLVDNGMASDCYAYNYSLRDPSLFMVQATATPGTASEKIERAFDEQLHELAAKPVSDAELDKAKKYVWKRMKLDAADPTGVSSQLAEAIAAVDWRWWVNFEKNIKAVTAADVQRVASQYFTKDNSTVGYYYPVHPPSAEQPPAPSGPPSAQGLLDVPAAEAKPQLIAAVKTDAHSTTTTQTAAAAANPAQSNQSSNALSPHSNGHMSIAAQVRKEVLPNGLTVLVMPVPGSGVVSIAGKIRAGDYFHPQKARCIPDFVSDMLDKGSQHFSKEKLAHELELMGTSLDFDSQTFFMTFQSDIVAEDMPQYMTMVADALEHPLFASEELDKSKKQLSAQIQAAMSDTSQVATNALYSTLYKPDCIYYQKPFKAQESELSSVTVEDLRQFHRDYITPQNTILAVVGDINADKAFEIVRKSLTDWQSASSSKVDVSDCNMPSTSARTIEKPLADKTDIEVILGAPAALDIRCPDFDAACLANAALGHDTISSRLGELRNKYGLTYGISSFFGENAYANAPWLIDFTVNPTNLSKALPIVQRILQQYQRQGITKQELQDEANRLGCEYIIERMRGPHQLADALARYEMLGLGAGFMDAYPARLKKVTVAQANDAIRKYFAPAKMVTVIAGTTPPAAKRH
jgi:zinc protease